MREAVAGKLTEAEEERVYTHAKNAEEATGDDVGPHDGGLQERRPIGTLCSSGALGGGERRATYHDGQPVVVEVGVLKVFAQPLDAAREEEEGEDTCGTESWGSNLFLEGPPPHCTPGVPDIPTPPTTSSFPKKSSRSVTLSRTTTLHGSRGGQG